MANVVRDDDIASGCVPLTLAGPMATTGPGKDQADQVPAQVTEEAVLGCFLDRQLARSHCSQLFRLSPRHVRSRRRQELLLLTDLCQTEALFWCHMPLVPPLRSLAEEPSHLRRLSTLAGAPCFLPLVRAILFVGLGNAVGGSYLTLFVVDNAHLSALSLGAFLTVYSLSGMIVSTSFGRWFDRTPSSIPLLLALAMTVSGYTLLRVTTDFYLLLLIAGVPLGTGLAVFPQLFALAKGHLDRVGTDTAERGMAMMRATWSIAWGVGPALGAIVISLFEFRGVFLNAAIFVVGAAVFVASARGIGRPPGSCARLQLKSSR